MAGAAPTTWLCSVLTERRKKGNEESVGGASGEDKNAIEVAPEVCRAATRVGLAGLCPCRYGRVYGSMGAGSTGRRKKIVQRNLARF